MTDIPRNLTVEQMLEDGDLYAVGLRLQIYLDGEKIDGCTAYDLDAGTVSRLARDGQGNLRLKNGKVVIETLTGKVKVSLLEQTN